MDKDIKLINIFTKQALKDRDVEKYNNGFKNGYDCAEKKFKDDDITANENWKKGNAYATELWNKEIDEIKEMVIKLRAINNRVMKKDEKQQALSIEIDNLLRKVRK